MRVTLLTVGSRGDVQPFIALGRALASAGHEVQLATHARFQDVIAGQGLTFAPLAEGEVSRGLETAAGRRWITTDSYRLPTWVGLLRDARSVASQRLVDAAAACQASEAIVASNLAMLLGWQMAVHRGIPLMRVFIEPPAWMMLKGPGRAMAPLVRQLAWLGARPWLNRIRRTTLGLPPVPRRDPLRDLDRGPMPVLYAFSPAVMPEVARVGRPHVATGFWFLDEVIDAEPSSELQEFLAAGPAPVLVGLSTMLVADLGQRSRLVIDALQAAGTRGLLQGAARPEQGPSLPADVLAVGDVSHQWLLPRCAAVVHHGGAGTTAAALRAGVPAVTIPHMSDQFFWARRLHELGVSPAPIPRRELTAQRLADAIRRAAGDERMLERARAVSAEVRAEDGIARAVEAFQEYVGGRFSPGASRAAPMKV